MSAELRERFSVAEVLNTVSHDIRAALAVTSGAAQELAGGQSPAELQRQLVGMIQRGNDRLARLAGNLVHLADLWEGRLQLQLARTALTPLVSQVVEELRQKQAARLRLELAPPAAEVWGMIDAERTRQVVGNVLGWALASARALVTVTLTAEPGGVVLIDDDGPPRGDPGQALGDAHKRVSSVALAYAVSEAVLRAQGGSFVTEAGKPSGFRARLQLGPAA